MKIETITSVRQFHQVFPRSQGRQVIYRGVKDCSYLLIPSLGRMTHIPPRSRKQDELWMFDEFKRKTTPHINATPSNDWGWLALAQHYGLPTRLLDWSENLLVALYFAVAAPFDGDSAIFEYENHDYITADHDETPFDITETVQFVPAHIDKRITAQGGVFTVHPKPFKAFASKSITKFILKNKIRRELKIHLNQYGTNAASIFPGPDGVAEQIKWDQSPDDVH